MQLYEEKDFQRAKRGMLIRMGVLAAITVAVIVLLVLFTRVWRNSTMCMAVCGVGAAIFVFYGSLKALPWFYYWRYQTDIRRGRAHDVDCAFVAVSDGVRMSDGVAFHEFTVMLDGDESADNQRLLFWDTDKTLPQLKEGQKLHIRAFGNYIIALETK